MEIVALTAEAKSGSGKEGAKQLRREGKIPAIMYKSGGGDATSFALNAPDIRTLVYTPKFKLAEINLDGKTHKAIVKDIQFHPVTDEVMHLDFLELVPGIKFKVTVPLRFTGAAPGVKAGGKFLTKLRQIGVVSTPETAVDEVFADISTMELGSTIRVRDIIVPEGVEIVNNGAVPIASIEVPRALRGGK
jgi:large subunit ribosomal protein L25